MLESLPDQVAQLVKFNLDMSVQLSVKDIFKYLDTLYLNKRPILVEVHRQIATLPSCVGKQAATEVVYTKDWLVGLHQQSKISKTTNDVFNSPLYTPIYDRMPTEIKRALFELWPAQQTFPVNDEDWKAVMACLFTQCEFQKTLPNFNITDYLSIRTAHE